MNKIEQYVMEEMSMYARRNVIYDYDGWASTGVVGESVLRKHARLLGEYAFGEDALKMVPITTLMKDLYVAVCRYFADMYLCME